MARPQPANIVNPPEKGSFPLDHLCECRPTIEEYYRCLARHDNLAPKCREEARAYLLCRMDRDLMNKEGTDKWLPRTEFVDTRYRKEEEIKNSAEDINASVLAERLRTVPDGYEKPRDAQGSR